ncbi:GH92 family glycosyl hydrolase [Burkholderia sp. 22PA0099]|uniref:GH92 family glycosyl hydrolase n=1 Tax=Burkholderia sp. 22PA0099 TaxID=3237372 RepID=UPI0039C4A672
MRMTLKWALAGACLAAVAALGGCNDDGGGASPASIASQIAGGLDNTPNAANRPGHAPGGRVDIAGLTQRVNVFIGTGAPDAGGLFPGNLNPGAQTPFGMVSFGPDTPGSGQPWGNGSGGYYYSDSSIDFFSLTHLSGPGCRGQGAVALIPGGGALTFSHADESASPGYYRVKTGNGVLNEFTATTRTGMARLSYPSGTASPELTLDATRSNGMKSGVAPGLVNVSVDTARNVVTGQTVVGAFCGGTWYKPVYFSIAFDTPLDAAKTTLANGVAKLVFRASAHRGAVVQMKAGMSSVSVANAQLNLATENPGWSFERVKAEQQAVWNHRLNTIQLDLAKPGALARLDGATAQRARSYVTQFYTALYHAMAGPTVYSDVNGDYRSMQQTDLNAAANTAPARAVANVSQYAVPGNPRAYRTHYAGFSLWDTYRSETQLQALLFPSETSDMMQSLVADARQCGAFPHWVDGSDDTKPMEGDHAPNVIAAAYAFGARGFDTGAARGVMLQSAFGTGGPGSAFVEGACNNMPSVDDSVGASPIADAYLKYGYVTTDSTSNHHPGSMTLELGTTDESIGNFLAALGQPGDVQSVATLHQRARAWAHLFNANIPAALNYNGGETSGLVPKGASGQWVFSGPDNGGFHESKEPNYLWTIGHDYASVIAALGGNAAAVARLNTLFGLNPGDPFGGPLPSAATLDSGENGNTLYIGNEPSLQTPWAYNWAGKPQLAQRVIPIVMKQTFFDTPGGLPGNDDVGATSTFYLWASLGLYPVVPSAPGLAMSTPQFKGMTVWLDDGRKKLRIEADDEALLNDKPYIKSVQLNGTTYRGSWLPVAAIAGGGTLRYTLSATPTDWATDPSLAPPSGPAADYTKATAPPSPSP